MDLKKTKLIVVILVVVSLIFSAVVSFQRNMVSLSLVNNTITASDGTIYLIDESDEYCSIYHIDKNGNSLGYITQPKVTSESYYRWESLYLYGGSVYFISYDNDISDNSTGKRALYRCDFENHSVENIIDLDNTSICYSYNINDDILELITSAYDEDYNPCIEYYSSSVQFSDFKENTVYTSIDYTIDYLTLVLDNENNIFFCDIDNQLYKVTGQKSMQRIYPLGGDSFGGVNEVSYDGDNRIYFIDCYEEKLMYYDISKDVCKEVGNDFYQKLEEYNQTHNTDYTLSDLKVFSFSQSGYFTASINTKGNTYAVLSYSTDGVQVIDRVKNVLSVSMLLLTALISFVVCYLALSVVVGLVYVLKKSYVSLTVRMLLIFLGLYGVIVVALFYVVKPYLNQTFEDLTYDNALYVCQNRLNRIGTVSDEDVERILSTRYNSNWRLYWEDITEGQNTVYSLINAQSGLDYDVKEYEADSGNLVDSNISSSDEFKYAVYFINDDNDVIMVYDSYYISATPIEYYKTKYVCDVVQKVISTGEKQFTDDLYLMQYANSIYAPIFNDDNKVVGVFEIRLINNLENSFIVNEMVNTLLLEITIVVLVLIVIVSIMLYVFLNPLKDLKDKAISLASGDIGTRVKPKGNNEVTALAVQFNRISQELEQKISSMNALKETYQYYVPRDVCTILKRLNMSAISVGDTVELPVAVLQIRISMEGVDVENRAFITTLNRFLENIVTLSTNHGGFIEHFDRHTIKVLYYKNYADAIRTAVSINEWVNTLRLTNSSFVPLVNVSISFENVNFTIIGNDEKMNFVTYSKSTLNTDELKTMYGSCSVVVTDEYVQKVPDFFEIFNSRFIGLSYIGGQPVKLFEVFNGNDLYNKNMKRIHKDNFEKAVKLYLTKDFRTARNTFVDIFENYPKDLLCKNYIRLCDDFIG